ncbi:MAG: hypothetical protein D6797_01665 [Bdellovibrio sp.]|nr:MAG: hypothetical protein D6797_01665 [Bdellovibrio sp.]
MSLSQNKLIEILNTSPNPSWEEEFLTHFPKSSLSLLFSEPQVGPDYWPYLFATITPESKEPSLKVLQWLSQKGIGLAIFKPQKQQPEYIFTYGMIWNFMENGSFIIKEVQPPSPQLILEKNEKILAGPPSEKFLPPYVRQILRQFFHDQKIKTPRILVLSKDKKHYDLCFSLESLGNPPQEEHQGILEAISWFLPPHYSLVLLSEEGLPSFHDL